LVGRRREREKMEQKKPSVRDTLTRREEQLIRFIRELGWGEVRLKVQEGQPVLIYEAIKTVKLEEQELTDWKGVRKRQVGGQLK
jgi:hypothetical protein